MSEQEADGDLQEAPQFEDDSSEEEIAEAKSMGWKDPSEWKGAPPKNGFQKAKDYVERGQTVLPIVRAELAKKEVELAKANKRLEDFKIESDKRFESLHRMSASALKRQRETLEAKYDAAISAAAEVGDKEEVKRLRTEEKAAVKEFDEAVEEKPELDEDNKSGKAKANTSDENKTIEAWIKEGNEWFNDDDDMRSIAVSHHMKLKSTQPDLSLEENLAKVTAYVKFKEADKSDDDTGDDDTPKRKGSPVESGGSRMGGAGSKSAWSRIPAEAQKQADKFIKDDNLFLDIKGGETAAKDLQKARERYAVEYLGEQK
jgi:hypothetical protein